ncbi:MAG: hypothetical protein WBB48_08010 [Thermodesulfobacteriota bacterium]
MNFAIKSLIIFGIFLLLPTIGCSGGSSESDFPKGCLSVGYEFQDNNLVLNESSSEQSLYLFHNISDESFWLNHVMSKDPGASAGWASELNAGNWSATALGTENFEVNCTILGSGEVKDLNCKEVVKVCKFEKPVFNSEDSGNYWVAENKPLSELLEAIKSRGISW